MDANKIEGFLNHLLLLPNIKKEPIVVAETIIINFIKDNYSKLAKTFTSPSFFPELSPNEVIKMLINLLYQRVEKELTPFLLSIIRNEIDYSFLTLFTPGVKIEEFKNNFEQLIIKLFKDINVRLNFKNIYYIFKTKAFDRYLVKAIERKQVIYNELFRIEKIPLKKEEEIINYFKFLTLLNIYLYYKFPENEIFNSSNTTNRKINIFDFKTFPDKKNYVDKLILNLNKTLKISENSNINKKIYKNALYSIFPESVVEKNDGIIRILYTFLIRYKEYKPYIKVDRGAETPDKSWYSIALKNYKFIGANQNILNELYLIAGDNMW